MPKMNPVVKVKWIAALRSGEYKQGKGELHHGEKFCCLGVLCDLAVKAGVIEPPTPQAGTLYRYGEHACCLPEKVSTWSGIQPIGELPSRDALAWMNDRGASFEEIADTIEQYL